MSLIAKIKTQIEEALPGEDAHLEMSPLYRQKSSEALKNNPNYKESAVAVILFEAAAGSGEYYCILTQRSTYTGKHSGQMSFPGGKPESNDASLLATALRETFEEIGIESILLEHIGNLTPVYIPVSNFKMNPFIFYCSEIPKFQLDPREVDAVINFKLTDLANDFTKSETEITLPDGTIRSNIPCFVLNEKIVWGATALVLNELKQILTAIHT